MSFTPFTPAMVLGGAAMLAALASGAAAQVVAAPGAPLAGVCVYSEELVLSQSQAGVAANQQLARFQQSVSAELKPANDALINDAKALEARKATTPAAQYQQSASDLQRRAQAQDALARTRNDQLVRTRDEAVRQIGTAALPGLNASLTAHRCSIVIDKGRVYSVNAAMDLTPEVIQKVNAALPTVNLQLAAPQQPQAPRQ
ncbi:MAG TPA: OmpH family outer membrane protein [Caulobacteraceae bacterium]|nr:OmpH family outer membrane protein [Caulobacteraceae bacterium]